MILQYFITLGPQLIVMEKKEGKTFDFMQDHSRQFLEMAYRRDRLGILEKPDGYGKRTGDCGDTVEMYLSVRGHQVQMVTFQVQGCVNTVACANTVAMLVEGRTVTDAWELTPDNVITYLETLPEDHTHCAELVVGTFYRALTDYSKLQNEPWKRQYLQK